MATGWSAHAELTSGYTALSAKSRKELADNTFNTLSCITVSRIARRDIAQQFMLGKNRLDIDFFFDLHSYTSLDVASVMFHPPPPIPLVSSALLAESFAPHKIIHGH